MFHRPDLTLVEGGCAPTAIGGVLVGLRADPAVDAVVVEEDTYHVLSTPTALRDPGEHPLRTIHDAWSAEPDEIGTVRVSGGNPIRLIAIVYDLSEQPCCRDAWVRSALEAVVDIARVRGLKRISIPPLGMRHGRLSARAVAGAMRACLLGRASQHALSLELDGDLVSCRAVLDVLRESN